LLPSGNQFSGLVWLDDVFEWIETACPSRSVLTTGASMANFRNSVSPERRAIDWVKPSPYHARIHPRRQRRKLANLLARYGQVRPLIVAPNGELIDGHAIWELLKESGHEEVDVVIVADQTPEALRALRLALNRSSEDAAWDNVKVRAEIEFLVEVGFDAALTAFDEPEIELFFQNDAPHANVIEEASAIPPLPQTPVTRPGDIYVLGRHHLGCGSALDIGFVNRVRGERLAAASLIDPSQGPVTRPYSGRGKHKRSNFMQDGETSPGELCQFYQGALKVLQSCSSRRSLIFAFSGWRRSLELTAAARLCGLPLLNICVWVKTNGGADSLYRSQHELVHVFVAGDKPFQNNAELGRYGRSRSNVWHYPELVSLGVEREGSLAHNLCAKPVKLLGDAIRDCTKRGDAVVDTFSHFGSTLIAAEETGRTCIGVELDPRYVDVAVARWQNTTGLDAVLERTGEKFNDRANCLAPAPRRLRHDR
jgi:hypothetical protein